MYRHNLLCNSGQEPAGSQALDPVSSTCSFGCKRGTAPREDLLMNEGAPGHREALTTRHTPEDVIRDRELRLAAYRPRVASRGQSSGGALQIGVRDWNRTRPNTHGRNRGTVGTAIDRFAGHSPTRRHITVASPSPPNNLLGTVRGRPQPDAMINGRCAGATGIDEVVRSGDGPEAQAHLRTESRRVYRHRRSNVHNPGKVPPETEDLYITPDVRVLH